MDYFTLFLRFFFKIQTHGFHTMKYVVVMYGLNYQQRRKLKLWHAMRPKFNNNNNNSNNNLHDLRKS